MLGKSIVARVVGRHGHDGTCTISGQNVLSNPDGNLFVGERIDGVGTGEDTGHLVVHLALTLGALLHVGNIVFHFLFLFGRGELFYQFTLGCQNHKGHTEHGIGTGGKDGEALGVGCWVLGVGCYFENHFRTFRASNPVALGFFQGVRPLNRLQTIEQTLGVSTYTQTPLAHLLLHHGESAANADTIHHFIIGQHGAQSGTPVHHRLAQISNTIVHQYLLLPLLVPGVPFISGEREFFALGHIQSLRSLLGKTLNEFLNWLSALAFVAIEGVEHLLESPLCPFIVDGFTGAYLTVPVETESNLIQLLAIAVDVGFGRDGRMLSGLDGILFGGQSVGIIAHGVQHIETLQTLEACIDITGDIAEWMAHMQARTAGVREHVEHIEFLFVLVFGNLIRLVLHPALLPFLLDFSEIVFHICFIISSFRFRVSTNTHHPTPLI